MSIFGGEVIRNHPDFTLPLDAAMPKFSMNEEKMGVTHQQWFNAYLERQSAYFERTVEEGGVPTVAEFHIELTATENNSFSWFGKVAAAVKRAVEPGREKGSPKRMESVSPMSLTSDGAKRVIEELKGSKTGALTPKQEEKRLSRAEQIGLFVAAHKLQLFDPRTGMVINPRSVQFRSEDDMPDLKDIDQST